MDFIVRIFTPDTHRAVIAGGTKPLAVNGGGEAFMTAGGQQQQHARNRNATPDRQKGADEAFDKLFTAFTRLT